MIIPCAYGSFVMVENEEEAKLRKSDVAAAKRKEKKVVAEEDFRNRTIDLHIEAIPNGKNVPAGQELLCQLDYFKRILRGQLKHRGSRIVFIHGIGDGVLKQAIREELDTTFALSCS